MDDKQGKEFGKYGMKQQRLLAVTLYKSSTKYENQHATFRFYTYG